MNDESDVDIRQDLKYPTDTPTPGGDTPGQQAIDENTIIMFHDKSKIEKYFSELLSLCNYFLVQNKKLYIPSIMCNSPRNIQNEAMIVLRYCDVIENYTLKHMKYNKLAENFKVHHFAFLDKNPINWKD